MRGLVGVFVAAVLVGASCVAAAAQPKSGLAATLVGELVDAVNARNMTAVQGLISPEGQFMIPTDAGSQLLTYDEFLSLLTGYFGAETKAWIDSRAWVDATPTNAAMYGVELALPNEAEYPSKPQYLMERAFCFGAVANETMSTTLNFFGYFKSPYLPHANASAMEAQVRKVFGQAGQSNTTEFMDFFSQDLITRDWGYTGTTWGVDGKCDWECTYKQMQFYNTHLTTHAIAIEELAVSGPYVAYLAHFFVKAPVIQVITRGIHVVELNSEYKILRWWMYGLDGPGYPHPQ